MSWNPRFDTKTGPPFAAKHLVCDHAEPLPLHRLEPLLKKRLEGCSFSDGGVTADPEHEPGARGFPGRGNPHLEQRRPDGPDHE